MPPMSISHGEFRRYGADPDLRFAGGTSGDYSFDAIRARHLSSALATGVMLLTLIGAGSKAGLVPLHAWLPLAHPAAPSHVSALMSGVMTKVALYGIIASCSILWAATMVVGRFCVSWSGR